MNSPKSSGSQGQRLSDFSALQNHPKDLLEHRWLHPALVSYPVGVERAPTLCIYNKFPGDTKLLIRGPCLENHCFRMTSEKRRRELNGTEYIQAKEIC